MFFSFFIIPILIIILHFLTQISNEIPSTDNARLIAVMKGHPKIQICQFSMHKYQHYLGLVYFMRKNWQCDKIAKEFEEYERTECQKYRKYLDILYEYLYREYVGIPTVKPKFVFEDLIDGPFIYAVNCLVKISQFYFIKWVRKIYQYKLNELFGNQFEPKLLNENRLNYEIKLENEQKLPINEMILQLAIDTANEWQTNEIVDEIIRQKFEENLEEILKKSEQNAKIQSQKMANKINKDKHFLIVDSLFDDSDEWISNRLLSEFVKGQATNLENFVRLINIVGFLPQKYEIKLVVLYLMQKNWKCDDKIEKKLKEICQKYRKYLDILYEYFFRLYAEAKNPKISKQLPPLVEPIFSPYSFIDIIEKLNNNISKYSWKNNYFLEMIHLLNEDEFNYEINEKKIGENASTNEIETNIAKLRNAFEQKLKNLCENAKKNSKAAKEELEKSKKESFLKAILLEGEYKHTFGDFDSSPFS